MTTAYATGEVVVRSATRADLDMICAVMHEAVTLGTASWRLEPRPREWFDGWFDEYDAAGQPILVAEIDGERAGYASYGPWRESPGYRFTVENSVYVRDAFHGRGVARALMTALIERARAAGMHVMIADISSDNAASLRLHERLGFEHVATIPEVGRKFDRWLDLAILRLAL
jgi:phosphinothricin acetyltransferase